MSTDITQASMLLPVEPVAVVDAGNALSPTVAQELATVLQRTHRSERRRRATLWFMVSGAGLLCGCLVSLLEDDVDVRVMAQAAVAAVPLVLHLAWGSRNRALLDVAAANAAVPAGMLVDALRRMRKHRSGPSAALRDARAAWPSSPG